MKKLLTCLSVLGIVTLSSLSTQMTANVPADQNADESGIITQDNPEQRIQVTRNLTSMPLAFTENQGQWDEQVLFRANAGGAAMWFSESGVYYQFTRRVPGDEAGQGAPIHRRPDEFDRDSDTIETMMIKASFVGANLNPRVYGQDMLEYKCNYYLGNDPTKWRTGVPNYRSIVYTGIYQGVDLAYYGNGREMEYDFAVSPGDDPGQIRIQYAGVKSLSVNADGQLIVETDWGSVTEHTPYIYQLVEGKRVQINGSYQLYSDNTFGFVLEEGYNPEWAMVIDPVLSYGTYLGGDGPGPDQGNAIVLDASGKIHVAGATASANFPNTTGNSVQGGDAFVTTLNPSAYPGNQLIYSTFIGGENEDKAFDIVLDNHGDLWITGETASNGFPTVNPYDATVQGPYDAFVVKISLPTYTMTYSTYLGGSGWDGGRGIAVDANGNAWVTGYTDSPDCPTTPGSYDQTHSGSSDVFLVELDPLNPTSQLEYGTFLGGSDWDEGEAVALDGSGMPYVTGYTVSSTFPTVNEYSSTVVSTAAFVAKFDPSQPLSQNHLAYCTLLGGIADLGADIALDGNNDVYVTGAASVGFVTKNAFQTTLGGGRDAFLAKIDCSKSVLASLEYGTFFGGSNDDYGYGLAVPGVGCVYLTGTTYSDIDFPLVSWYDNSFNGAQDIFVALLVLGVPPPVQVRYSTYLGGSQDEGILAGSTDIAADGSGDAYVVSVTGSADLPTTPDAFDAFLGGVYDAFMAKLTCDPDPCCYASGEIDGISPPLTVGDLTVLIDFVCQNGPAPNQLHEADLNGDCCIDQADIDMLLCYLFSLQGYSCFPQYPVPTCCPPGTTRGACCDDNQNCFIRCPANCLALGHHYWGDGTPCTPNPCPKCLKPPSGLLSWWPLEAPIAPDNFALDVAGGRHGHNLIHSQITTGPGKVGDAYEFNWGNSLGIVRVLQDPFVNIGTGDFTIDAWIYPVDLDATQLSACAIVGHKCLQRVIVDNHYLSDGVRFFVERTATGTGYLGLLMNGVTFLSSTDNVILNDWQHVAVSVQRTGGSLAGTFYYDGSPIAGTTGPTFVPVQGLLLGNPGPQFPDWPRLHIGHGAPNRDGGCTWTDEYFMGHLDEVQIFGRALDAGEIAGIYNAQTFGKCHDNCYLPPSLGFPLNQSQITTTLTIYNEGGEPASYDWSALGVGSATACNYLGPVPFPIMQGTTPLILSGKSDQVVITIDRPYGFGLGDVACYTMNVVNNLTGETFSCEGSITGMNYNIVVIPPSAPWHSSSTVSSLADSDPFSVIDMYIGDTAGISFGVENLGDSGTVFEYEIAAISSCLCGVDSIISLDGLPPGTNVTGSISIPEGDSAVISVTAELLEFEPFRFTSVALLSDWDTDGDVEPGASAGIRPRLTLDCNDNGVHDSVDIAIGTSPDTNSNAIPDECEYYHQPYPYCYAGLGQADITAYGDSMVVSNIGSTSDDGVRLQSDGPEDLIFRCDLSHIDLSIPDAAVAFQFNGSTATSRIPSSAQSPQSTVLSGCGIANSGGALQVVGDFNPLGDPNVLMQVYNAGVKAGESSMPSGGVIAIGNDAGYGLPSVVGVEMDATDPPTFTITLDRVTQFNLIGGSVFDGDEIRLVCENATETIEGLTSFDITGKNLEYFVITEIEITSGSCCRGFTGNVDDDPTDMIDLGDLTALIDYLFISFTPPVCMEEANIDGDVAGTVDLGDLTALIDFLFISFTPPAECL